MQNLQRETKQEWKTRTPIVRDPICEITTPNQIPGIQIRKCIAKNNVVLEPDLHKSGNSSYQPECNPQTSQSRRLDVAWSVCPFSGLRVRLAADQHRCAIGCFVHNRDLSLVGRQ